MHNIITIKDELQDIKKGKKKPWRLKKVKTLVLSDSLARLDYKGRAARVKFCGTVLDFERNDEGELYLKRANFCKHPLCPMCQWRKSLRLFMDVGKIMDEVQRREPDIVPIFLTLTVRNCAVKDFGAVVEMLLKGWYNLYNDRTVKGVIKGWFRALEITYNRQRDEFHPHIHAIILVDKSYFTGDDYLKTDEWRQLWERAAKLDYFVRVDVRRCKTPKGQRKEVAEVAKYVMKDAQILRAYEDVLTDRLVEALSTGIHGRRLVAYGGIMKTIAKEFGADKPEKGDLVNVGDTVRGDVAVQIERYRWSFGVMRYIRVRGE